MSLRTRGASIFAASRAGHRLARIHLTINRIVWSVNRMMDLRAAQTALSAGRTASRWATTAPSTPLVLARHISSTRPLSQEAEAEAEAPPRSSTTTSSGPPRRALSMADMALQRKQPDQRSMPGILRSSAFNSSSGSGSSSSSNNKSSSPSSSPWSSSLSVPTMKTPSKPSTNLASWATPSQAQPTDLMISKLGIKELVSRRPVDKPEVEDFHLQQREQAGHPRPEEVKMRLRPGLGRVVDVQDNIDFATALRMLSQKCTVNRVAADASRQKFHERPGKKRKRLKSSRWRYNFKLGFRATCDRVSELAKQGW